MSAASGDRRQGRWRRPQGVRGTFLASFAVVHIAVGLAYTVPANSHATARSLSFLAELGIPITAAGIAWIATGLVAAAAALRRPGHDGHGFIALMAMEVAWTCIMTLSWAFGDSPRGYFLAIVFAALAVAVRAVSRSLGADEVHRTIQGDVP